MLSPLDHMEIIDQSAKETLWHTMRADFEQYYPETRHNHLLMCCTCGRLLPFDSFTIEHIAPQQALKDDPIEIRTDPRTTKNIRAGLMLLCNSPLLLKGGKRTQHGCNSWKGRFYDSALRELMNGSIIDHKHRKVANRHLVALLCAGYIAMVREYGYQIALTDSGVLMRNQYFHPDNFFKGMPLMSQMTLTGPPADYAEDRLDYWTRPFKFSIQRGKCLVIFRSMGIYVPISRDPITPIARHLKFVPSKYRLRPDFGAAFDQ